MSDGRQSGRERVMRALARREPERTPFAWGFCATTEMQALMAAHCNACGVDWPVLRDAASDVLCADPVCTAARTPDGADIWGIRWRSVAYDGGTYQEVAHPPLAGVESVAALAAYPWPDPEAYDVAGLHRHLLEANAGREKAVRISGGNPLEIYTWMTGMEEAFINLLSEPDLVVAALGHITGFFENRLVRILREVGDRIDLVFLADDLGSQTGPLISGEIYRTLIQPFHRRLVDAIRREAPEARILFHSDGSVYDLMPDLIVSGFDALEAVQTECKDMQPERLKAEFGGAISFHGALSVQQLLPRADEAEVERECRRICGILGAGGGYIAAPSHAIQVGTPPVNVLAMLRGVLGEADYSAALAAAKKK